MGFDPNEKRDSHGRWTRLAGLLDANGGFTHNLGKDTERDHGYAVAIAGHEQTFEGKATADNIKRYVARHLKALGHKQAHLGAWFNSQDGKSYLDVSHVRSNFTEALTQARKDKQIALYDLGTGNEYHTMSEDWQPNLDAMKGTDLTGLPSKPTATPGHGSYVFHSNKDLQAVANGYIAQHGRSPEPTDYSTVDPAKAARVAKAFEEMKDDPHDPEVARAYAALKTEVAAQYEALTKAGYSYHFYPEGGDPYANTPREAVYDLTHNHKMFVYPTIGPDGGFGSDGGVAHDHPLLEKVPGVEWDGHPVTYNDMFRGVHDSMAHSKEGVGFGPRGEDNAYRQHFATFSADAQKALASETRGQNTWVNYGPHGEHNRTDPHNTIFAPQKAGILPPWAIDPEFLKKEESAVSLSTITPTFEGLYDLSARDGHLAFWKQILPKKTIHYTAKDGSRQTLDFTEQYLRDLADSTAVDKVGFLLADKDNAHTMDPERWRGEVTAMEVREDGLYGKIVFPSVEAARAVLDNPALGVSARIRENVGRSDGSTVSRGIVHVLGTLDPQVSGMTPWQPTDLSASQDEVLDLSEQEYADMAENKALADYTEADIDAMDEKTLDAFLAEFVPGFDATLVDETDEHEDEDEDADKGELVGAGADMSNGTGPSDLDLANARADQASAFANEALRRVADAEWREERTGYLGDGVPPAALDLAAPVLNRASDMVIDLSNSGEDDVNVSAVVRGLLDSLKGTVDLSIESGHFGTHSGEDNPDQATLDRWKIVG